MAGKKENLKALFTNTRSRVIIIFTLILLVLAVVIGLFRFMGAGSNNDLSSDVTNAPGGIQSIPGALNPTAQYAKLQESQNKNQANTALESGSSAIPTIIRSQTIGSGVDVVGAKNGQAGGVGFSDLNRENELGLQRSAWIDELQKSNCDAPTVKNVVSAGATITDLKNACSCIQLKDHGYPLKDLQKVCTCNELKAAGFNARQFKDSGFTIQRLRECGFNACELRNAGFSAQEMKDGGFSDGELLGAGFTNEQIARASGIPSGIKEADVQKAGCDLNELKRLRQAGVSAAAIRRLNGCSPKQLKAAGYTAQDLHNAGFTAASLKDLYTPEELRLAGYNARELLDAGFTSKDLEKAGFSPAAIQEAESELPPGFTAQGIEKAGCGDITLRNERLASLSAKLIRKYAACTAAQLRAGGFTPENLSNAGFTSEQIANDKIAPAVSPASDEEIKSAGCEPQKLAELYRKGVTAKKIRELNGCTVNQLKAGGYDAKAMTEAGFSPKELLAAGFTPAELQQAGVAPAGLIASGRTTDCNVDSLKTARQAGVSASTIRQTLGCNAAAMKEAGYTADELKGGGFTAAELKDAGFNAAELKAAGFNAKELKSAGFDAAELKAAGFNAKDLKEAGFNAKELKDAGLSPDELKALDFSVEELKEAGIVPSTVAVLMPPPPQPVNPSNMPAIPGYQNQATLEIVEAANEKKLQQMLNRQKQQLADQQYQQRIQQRTSEMLSVANQSIQEWGKVSTQVYIGGDEGEGEKEEAGMRGRGNLSQETTVSSETVAVNPGPSKIIVKTGDVLFAVIDTSVNSDEPGPILATIVSGKLKGARLIGSFNLPPTADKMVITFNTLSVPGLDRSTSINAYAIDPNTARTALSSKTNHHYLMRYGSLFASSFLEGIGNAFQSADTTVTVDGAGGNGSVTVQNGIDRSLLDNAVIALSLVGKNWGQAAQQVFNTPTTVEVYSGTGIGVLFTQDITI